MTHPHHHHATRAAWALHHALHHLQDAINRAATAGPADGIRSTTWGTTSGGTTTSDPVSTAALSSRTATRYQLLLYRTTDTITWLADQLGDTIGYDPLSRILTTIVRLTPATAAEITRWLDEAEQRIRRELHQPPAEQPLPANPRCPACRSRMLRVHTAAPNPDQWTATCGSHCVCTGPGCPCGMPTRVDGVQHIWTRPQLFAALRTARRRAAHRTAA